MRGSRPLPLAHGMRGSRPLPLAHGGLNKAPGRYHGRNPLMRGSRPLPLAHGMRGSRPLPLAHGGLNKAPGRYHGRNPLMRGSRPLPLASPSSLWGGLAEPQPQPPEGQPGHCPSPTAASTRPPAVITAATPDEGQQATAPRPRRPHKAPGPVRGDVRHRRDPTKASVEQMTDEGSGDPPEPSSSGRFLHSFAVPTKPVVAMAT